MPFEEQSSPSCRPHNTHPATVSVHALSCGHFTLPEYQFVHPVSRDARKSVPSLAFLIQHYNSATERITRVVFDLGLRKDIKEYAPPIQKHVETRQPMSTDPDVTKSLARGGLAPDDIDYVIYSHVHWDHIGEPRDFPNSTFIVGHGALALLNGTSSSLRGGHSFFEHNLLPEGRTIELLEPSKVPPTNTEPATPGAFQPNNPWKAKGSLPHTLDLFGDGSVLIVNAPGHLPGHINLLARTSPGHQVYMAGDACHDRRLLTGEKSIGEWNDAHGHVCCIHADRKQAEETIERIRVLEKEGVEVIFAHDVEWENDPANHERFFALGKWGSFNTNTTPHAHESSCSISQDTSHTWRHANCSIPKSASRKLGKAQALSFKLSSCQRESTHSIPSLSPAMSLTPEQRILKKRFDATLGPAAYDESWDRMLKHAPDMFASSVRLTNAPKKRGALSPKIQSLVSIAVSAASTHLYSPSIQRHTKAALAHGATKAEIVEVLSLTSTLGIHACTTGVPILFEVLEEQGKPMPKGMEGMSKEQWAIRKDFEKKRGYWNTLWEEFLRLSPEFFDAYTEFSSVPWVNEGGKGVLEPKVKELIYCAFDTAATHMYQPGLKLHMRNVLNYGGTAEEIMEVMELATLLSISTMDVGLEVLEKELAKQ
ncbi:AhpD-like protein [Paraphoma chrysanthemicola]|uniref:AhpD-like protein n=1 Tax=Paraphoma chrysanthemicola TaxID=798071 RepID=A0A8K0RFW1_9PLEO|nr:AhpD-like protein [Paraphoma chrysanthemicola]